MLRDIIANASPVVVVIGTGVGKSMLFMLLASVPASGTTIVVVLLTALLGDLVAWCTAIGINVMEWWAGAAFASV